MIEYLRAAHFSGIFSLQASWSLNHSLVLVMACMAGKLLKLLDITGKIVYAEKNYFYFASGAFVYVSVICEWFLKLLA